MCVVGLGACGLASRGACGVIVSCGTRTVAYVGLGVRARAVPRRAGSARSAAGSGTADARSRVRRRRAGGVRVGSWHLGSAVPCVGSVARPVSPRSSPCRPRRALESSHGDSSLVGYGTCSLSLGRRLIRRRRVWVGPRVTVQRARSGVDYTSYHSSDTSELHETYGGDRASDPCPRCG